MQVKFRVEVRRCYLSRELTAQDERRSRRGIRVARNIRSSRDLRKGLKVGSGDPQPVQEHG